MGTLTSTDPACQGAVVNGVILGDPALDDKGAPIWDDHRIPDGVIGADGVVIVDVQEEDDAR